MPASPSRSPATTRHKKASAGSRCPPPGARHRQSCGPTAAAAAPTELWATFDTAWEDLNKALEGISLPAVARAFGELATVLRQLATAVAEEDAESIRAQHG